MPWMHMYVCNNICLESEGSKRRIIEQNISNSCCQVASSRVSRRLPSCSWVPHRQLLLGFNVCIYVCVLGHADKAPGIAPPPLHGCGCEAWCCCRPCTPPAGKAEGASHRPSRCRPAGALPATKDANEIGVKCLCWVYRCVAI